MPLYATSDQDLQGLGINFIKSGINKTQTVWNKKKNKPKKQTKKTTKKTNKKQAAHGPQVAHLSDIATADMQILCNIFPILSLQLMKRSS